LARSGVPRSISFRGWRRLYPTSSPEMRNDRIESPSRRDESNPLEFLLKLGDPLHRAETYHDILVAEINVTHDPPLAFPVEVIASTTGSFAKYI
jgi:hypothetical protein